jgi:hypothetical protein
MNHAKRNPIIFGNSVENGVLNNGVLSDCEALVTRIESLCKDHIGYAQKLLREAKQSIKNDPDVSLSIKDELEDLKHSLMQF